MAGGPSDERQVFYPSLRYRDARAAIDWLGKAFGFEQHMVVEGEDGTIAHAELGLGPGRIMLGDERPGDPFGSRAGQGWAYVVVVDPDALFERATEAGAEVVMEPFDTPHGSRDFSVRDPEGNTWSFGTYSPER